MNYCWYVIAHACGDLLSFPVRRSDQQVLQAAPFSGPPGGPKTTRAQGEPALSWFTFCRGGFGPARRPQNRGQNPVQFSCLHLVPHGVRCCAGRGVRLGRSARKGAWMPFWKSTAPVAPPEPFARPPLSALHCELRMGQHELHRDCSAPGPTHRDGHTHTHLLTDARTHTLKPKQTVVSPCLCSRRGFV